MSNIKNGGLLLLFFCFFQSILFAQKWTKVSAGAYFSAALRSDGTIWETGQNVNGVLGQGDTTHLNYFTQVEEDTDWTDIAAGNWHILALKSNGSLWAWGDNIRGQVGVGDSTNRYRPQRIGTDNDWVYISAGSRTSYAIKKDGSLWTWGWNVSGQIGDGTQIDRILPVNIEASHKWLKVGGGWAFTLALRDDGTIWGWGSNAHGQLGSNNFSNFLVPIQIGSDIDWSDISANWSFCLALKKNATLWSWGRNVNGELGLGIASSDTCILPHQVGHDKDWAFIATGCSFSFGIKKDATLYGWGSDINGQLGDNSTNEENGPEQIGNDHNWIMVSGAHTNYNGTNVFGNHTLGIKGNTNTLCVTGDNGNGQLGNGTFAPDLAFDCSITTSGINPYSFGIENKISVYPNPTTDHINISFRSDVTNDRKIKITDLSGKIIYTRNELNNSPLVQLDISTYPKGIYIMEIVSNNNVFTSKIVKD